MNYFIHDKRDLSPAYVKSCKKFLDNLKLKAAARPPKSSPKLQASSALKRPQLKSRIKI